MFNSKNKNTIELSELIKNQIQRTFGFDVPTFVESIKFFSDLSLNNPFFNDQEIDVSKYHVTILNTIPTEKLDLKTHKNDKWILIHNVIYLFCPDGYGRTKFTNTFFEKKLNVSATTRNWKTILALIGNNAK